MQDFSGYILYLQKQVGLVRTEGGTCRAASRGFCLVPEWRRSLVTLVG